MNKSQTILALILCVLLYSLHVNSISTFNIFVPRRKEFVGPRILLQKLKVLEIGFTCKLISGQNFMHQIAFHRFENAGNSVPRRHMVEVWHRPHPRSLPEGGGVGKRGVWDRENALGTRMRRPWLTAPWLTAPWLTVRALT